MEELKKRASKRQKKDFSQSIRQSQQNSTNLIQALQQNTPQEKPLILEKIVEKQENKVFSNNQNSKKPREKPGFSYEQKGEERKSEYKSPKRQDPFYEGTKIQGVDLDRFKRNSPFRSKIREINYTNPELGKEYISEKPIIPKRFDSHEKDEEFISDKKIRDLEYNLN